MLIIKDTSNIKTAALFVDFENLYYGILNALGGHPDRAMHVVLDVLNTLRRRVRKDQAALVLERCYADWERIPTTPQRHLQTAGIQPRYTASKIGGNSADIEMSLDILEYVLTSPPNTHILIAGGDRDYLPIIHRIKENNLNVCVCAFKHNLSGDIREFINNYVRATLIELDDLWEGRPSDFDSQVVESRRKQKEKVQIKSRVQIRSRDSDGVETPSEKTSLAPHVHTANLQSYVDNPKPVDFFDWHTRYIDALTRFICEKDFREVHFAPFLRWMGGEGLFSMLSVPEQRSVFNDLIEGGVVEVEDRASGKGYTFTVVHMNWEHPLVMASMQALTGRVEAPLTQATSAIP